MQSNRSAILIQKKKQIVPQENDKSSQSIKQVKSKHGYLNSQSTVKKCSGKNCQENKNINMQSVIKEMDMWLPKPAIRRLCSDKNCQSTKC